MIKHSRYHHVDSAIVYGLAVLSIVVLSNVERTVLQLEQKIAPRVVSTTKVVKPLFNSEAFLDISIQGKAYVLYDIVDKKIIAGKNEESVLPLASITKVMTAYTARTHYAKEKPVIISKRSIEDGYDLGLRSGQVFSLDELLKYTLVFSSNDGAQAVADALGGRDVFVNQMNDDAKSLGLTLHFTSPAGLDENGKIGGEGSAVSVAKLFAVARRSFPEVFEATTKTRANVLSSTGRITGVPNTNQEVNHFEGVEMSKTGFTDIAGGNLAIVVNVVLGHPVVIVVLGSTREERFSDMQILYNALEKSIER